MKKNNLILELLKMFGACICGWLLWLIIFSITLPPDETGATSEPFPGAICVLGIVTAVVILLIIRYNKLQKAYQRTKSFLQQH